MLPLENDRHAAFVTRNEQLFVPKTDCIYLNDHARGGWAALPAQHVRAQFSAFFREPEQIVWFDEFQFGLQPIPELTYHSFVKRVAPLCQSINLLPSSLLHQPGMIDLVE
jgi:hypothetical protein